MNTLILVSSFPANNFFDRNVSFTPLKNAFAQRKFKIAMKQPTLASFNFKRSSNDQDEPSLST